MRADVELATQRVILARARFAELNGDAELDEIEDELLVGYAQALALDALLLEGDNRLHELIEAAPSVGRARELRALAAENAELQRDVVALRHELSLLLRERNRVRASDAAPSSPPAQAG
jgi:hypothetical protein